MITLRPSHDRGAANFGWLDSRHSFSFGNYYDPTHMGFSSLRVINEDKIAPSQGFSTHGHRDMEIVTYVLSGGLAHKDSIGNGSVIRHGDVQRMSAGTGIMHSEYNASSSEPVHLLQIWLLPDTQGLPPSYEEKHLPVGETPGQLRLIGSQDGRDGSVIIHQDVTLYAALLNDGDRIAHNLGPSRWAWLQVAHGALQVNDQTLTTGDAAGIVLTADLDITAQAPDTEFLLFDLVAV